MRTLIAAKISFNNGQSTLDCLIRNLSDTGAKLIVSAAIALPDGFDLLIPQKSVTRRVRIVWRRGEAMGVRFDEGAPRSESRDPDASSLTRRMRELAAEVARLQSRILQLTEG
jgi:PilZ domain